MATGRNNKLVGQTGEYLVAAELSRRGLISTTFTGNVPYYDMIAECVLKISALKRPVGLLSAYLIRKVIAGHFKDRRNL